MCESRYGSPRVATAVETSTEQVARSYFAALVERDVDAMAAHWRPGTVDRLVGLADLTAPDDVRDWFAELFGAMPDFSFEVVGTTTEDDRCAVRWHATGTFTGPGRWQGLDPNGARVEIEGCDVVRVADGLIVGNDAYTDGATIARQLGLMPPAGSPLEQRLTAVANVQTRVKARAASAPAEPVADGVWLLRGGLFRAMNVYLIEEPDGSGVTAFDAGERGMPAAILSAAAERGGLRRVVLSHGDDDHRGAAPFLGAPVLCHPAEVEACRAGGDRDYWRMEELPAVVRRFHRLMHDHVWDGGPVEIADTLTEGDEVAGFRVVETPGHAPGLIALFRESDRVALISDALYVTDMWGRERPAGVPVEAYNLDTEQARASVRKLADLDPSLACVGHLGPIEGPDVPGQLRAAAER
jgi:glyoxylase-like metal-dependent hydrolase (beta-lactamase superfamily II)/predicted ester cyclase